MSTARHYGRTACSRLIFPNKMSFVASLLGFVMTAGCAGPRACAPYEVTIPEEWKPHVSVGKLKVLGPPFYGVIQPRRSLVPLVRINWSLKNLTSDNLDAKVNYWSRMTTDKWKTGFGVPYKLGPKEERTIDNIYPVVSAQRPVQFGIRMVRLQAAGGTELLARHNGVMTEVLPVLPPAADNLVVKQEQRPHFVLKSRKLMYSQERGNLFVAEVTNRTNQERPLVVYAAAGDPNRFDIGVTDSMGYNAGPLAKSIVRVSGHSVAKIEVPYVIPGVGRMPLLAFTFFEPSEEWLAPGGDMIKHRIEPFCWGWYDLCEAAERGQAKLPVLVPVEERTKLTAERESEHFLFRYRPGSYSEQNIESIIAEREQAYDHLSSILQMELPDTTTIDLYPDMESKGLGSGTTYTACNTRSNKHIAEVHSEAYQCGAYHELAHIFSYHFPNYRCNRGGLVETFAAYFEPHNMPIPETKHTLRRKLHEGELNPLGEVLHSGSSSEELVIAIDFLLKKDVDKFKKLYVRATCAEQKKDLEKAAQQIYGTDLKGLDKAWREFINPSEGI